MSRSVLEQELVRKMQALRGDLASHDRAVIVGFFLSLFPIPPVSIIGLIISIFNYWLFRSGKLDLSERKMIISGILLGVVTSTMGSVFFFYVATQIGGMDWDSIRQAFDRLIDGIRHNTPLRWMSKENVLI